MNRGEERVRTLALTSVVLVVAGIVLILFGPMTDYGTAVFGGIVLAAGVLVGVGAFVYRLVKS